MPPPPINPRCREWRFQNVVVPLRLGDPAPTTKEGEAPVKPLNEIAYMTIRALQEKQQTPVLMTALANLLQDLSTKPGSCVSEQELVDTLKTVAQQVLPPEESEKIFPMPIPDAAKKVSRKLVRRRTRSRTTTLSAAPSLADN